MSIRAIDMKVIGQSTASAAYLQRGGSGLHAGLQHRNEGQPCAPGRIELQATDLLQPIMHTCRRRGGYRCMSHSHTLVIT